MKWFNFPIIYGGVDSTNTDVAILENTTSIMLNDDNLKPDWVAHPAAFSEFHVRRNSNSILIVIGESWTYGESLPGIATALQHYDIYKQLSHCFGPKLALTMGCDYYQYAAPGNCNLYMFEELKRIVRYVATQGYNQIYICQQMTEQGRDNPILQRYPDHPLVDLYTEPCTFDEFLAKYDDIFFKIYDDLLAEFSHLNINAVLWRNFCKVNTRSNGHRFKVIDPTWIEYSAKMVGKQIESPKFYVAGWVDHLQQHYSKKIRFNLDMITAELDKIEASNAFIKTNPLHNNHPNPHGHTLWAQYLGRQAGWIRGI